MTPYEILERVRALLVNATESPLVEFDDQVEVLFHLEQLRLIYRRNHDAMKEGWL